MQQRLYSIVDKETLHAMVESFYGCIELPVQVMDESGDFLESFGNPAHFCRVLNQYLPKERSCKDTHVKAAKQAVEWGQSYVFSCPANLNHIIFPLISKEVFLGSILVGPFLMDEADSFMLLELSQKYGLNTEHILRLYEEIGSVPIVTPARINSISGLLHFLFCNLIGESKEQLRTNQQKLLQQSRINESIQRYKNIEEKEDSYPYEREKELILKTKTGSIKEAKAILNDLLGYVLFSEGSSLEVVKMRAIELSSLLSRAAIEGGAQTDSILKLNNQFLMNIQTIDTMDSLCLHLQEIVETFTESMFHLTPNKNSESMKQAMMYISTNFHKELTLEDVAGYVHLHPAYFSTVFKQSIGSSFKEYLNMVRIEESKRLLINTDYSIIDIAVSIGFEDQSYFSKVFKKYTGMTPKQFR